MKAIQLFRRPSETAIRSYRTQIRSSPVFVIGGARSGTSILAILLRKYLGISFGTESQFFIRFFNRLQDYGDLNNKDSLKKLLFDISRERCFQRWRKWDYILDVNKINSRIRETSYSGIIDAIFNDLAEHNQMHRWGDKTPEYMYHLDVLDRLFPMAQYVHIVRDGRDVALSAFQTHFGAENIIVAALGWRRQLECTAAFKRKVGSDKVFEFKYEELLENPVLIFTKLMSFLNIFDTDGMMRRSVENNLAAELKRDNFNKWKATMSEKDQIRFETVAHSQLLQYGYPVVTDGQETLSTLAQWVWKIDNKFRNLRRIDYWLDNLYKFKVHTRALQRTFFR